MLSIGGSAGSYTLASSDDPRRSSSWPLGDAVPDGIDFNIEGGTSQHWDEHAKYLSVYSRCSNKKLHEPALGSDAWIRNALKTVLFGLGLVQFYNNPPCDDVANLEEAWKQLTSTILASKIFLSLRAAPQAAGSGFIPAAEFTLKILPNLESPKKYGSIILWSMYHDDFSGCSASISGDV
ncbi:hypothetical protein ACJRO7_002674 [Eucalyptus globulus]|uniref:Uncharacterized protein n=1 Tax=Eucalyptus globulus TaxID=34317 RepID=A0ABD3LYI3_EUCGL